MVVALGEVEICRAPHVLLKSLQMIYPFMYLGSGSPELFALMLCYRTSQIIFSTFVIISSCDTYNCNECTHDVVYHIHFQLPRLYENSPFTVTYTVLTSMVQSFFITPHAQLHMVSNEHSPRSIRARFAAAKRVHP